MKPRFQSSITRTIARGGPGKADRLGGLYPEKPELRISPRFSLAPCNIVRMVCTWRQSQRHPKILLDSLPFLAWED